MLNDFILFFDVDQTLYPADCGLLKAIGEKIEEYIETRLGIAKQEIKFFRQDPEISQKTTLQFLHEKFRIDPKDYLSFVHNIPLEKYIPKNSNLKKILKNIPNRKYIFTNASNQHAKNILDYLGIKQTFIDIFDIALLFPLSKYDVDAFPILMQLCNNPDPSQCVLIDDSKKVLDNALKFGFHTIWVTNCMDLIENSHVKIPSINEIEFGLELLENSTNLKWVANVE